MLMPGLALIVWVLVFAAGLVGLAVGARLPDRHRTDESRSVVSVSMAMVGTLTALSCWVCCFPPPACHSAHRISYSC